MALTVRQIEVLQNIALREMESTADEDNPDFSDIDYTLDYIDELGDITRELIAMSLAITNQSIRESEVIESDDTSIDHSVEQRKRLIISELIANQRVEFKRCPKN